MSVAIRYAKVRRLECSLKGPKGLDLERLREIAASDAFGGDRDAERRNKLSYWDSNDCSMFLYSFRSPPAAFVV